MCSVCMCVCVGGKGCKGIKGSKVGNELDGHNNGEYMLTKTLTSLSSKQSLHRICVFPD